MKNKIILIFSLTFSFNTGIQSFGQYPIYQSTSTSTSAPPSSLSAIVPSIINQNGNFIGIGTSTPTERLTLRYNGEIVNIGGLPTYVHRSPAIRFDFVSTSDVNRSWLLQGGENFILNYITGSITPIRVNTLGEVMFMNKVHTSVNGLTGENSVGFIAPDANTRKIYWTSFTSGVNNTNVGLDFVYDVQGAGTTDVNVMRLMPSGQVRIGNPNTQYQNFIEGSAPNSYNSARLSVNGVAVAKGFIATEQNWADFVFYAPENNPTLAQEEKSIQENCTLVGVPTEEEASQGRNLAENDALLLQKLEQLYLHVIELNRQVEQLAKENAALKALLNP